MSTPERDGVSLTHLDEPLFDGAGATKRDLVDYLEAVAPLMLPDCAAGRCRSSGSGPGSGRSCRRTCRTTRPVDPQRHHVGRILRREVRYPLCDDRRTLLWLANQRAVEYHPTLGLAGHLDRPSYLVLDIDPPPGGPFGQAVAAARLIRQALTGAGLAGAVKTSGSKGLHVYVPVEASSEEAAAVTRAIAARAERLDPGLATTAFIKDDREGKVFLDSTRAFGATVAAVYSPRVRPGVRYLSRCAGKTSTMRRPATSPCTPRPGWWPAEDAWPGSCPRRRR